MFAFAYKTFNLFFALRLKIVSGPDVIKTMESEKPMTYDDIMKNLVNCCKE
jgi:hypothetical protein